MNLKFVYATGWACVCEPTTWVCWLLLWSLKTYCQKQKPAVFLETPAPAPPGTNRGENGPGALQLHPPLCPVPRRNLLATDKSSGLYSSFLLSSQDRHSDKQIHLLYSISPQTHFTFFFPQCIFGLSFISSFLILLSCLQLSHIFIWTSIFLLCSVCLSNLVHSQTTQDV